MVTNTYVPISKKAIAIKILFLFLVIGLYSHSIVPGGFDVMS